MGTDIHIEVEIFKDGGWHLADVKVTDDRKYRAFAVLANVCNGYRFGGSAPGMSSNRLANRVQLLFGLRAHF